MDPVEHMEKMNHKRILKLSLAILFICGKTLMDFISTGLVPQHKLLCLLNDTYFSINFTFEANHTDS